MASSMMIVCLPALAIVCGLAGAALPPMAAAAFPPHRVLALDRAADSLFDAGDYAGAARRLEEMRADSPGRPEVAVRLVRAYRQLGRHEDANRLLPQLITAGFVDPAAAWLRLAQGAARAGRRDSALACLRRALDAGYHERPSLKTDEAFAALARDTAFRRLAGFSAAADAGRAPGWREDLDFLLTEARRLHASPRRLAHSAGFAAALAAIKGRIAELDDVAVAMEIQKALVAHLDDGHTVLYPMSTPRVDFGGMLPVRFYFFGDGLFVVGAGKGYENLVGSEVVTIGRLAPRALRAGLQAIVSHDNDQGVEFIGWLYLSFPSVLRTLGAAPSLEEATLTVKYRSGTRTVTLPAVPFEMPERPLPAAPGAPVPLWLSHRADVCWHTPRPDLNAVYAQMNQVRDPEGGPTLEEWSRTLRAEIGRTGARNLILDLRHNNGGNNFLTWPIVRVVAWHEMADPANRTYVLTGPGVFSACQNLVNHLERATNAVFVGSPGASRPNFTGEDNWVELPWSGLRLSISSRWWQDSFPTDYRPYVPVSMPVALTSADWKAGRDPVLEELGAYLTRGRP